MRLTTLPPKANHERYSNLLIQWGDMARMKTKPNNQVPHHMMESIKKWGASPATPFYTLQASRALISALTADHNNR